MSRRRPAATAHAYIQLKYLPRLLGYLITDIGVQFQVVHLWRYEDHAERDRCRAAMKGDPAWQA